MNKLIYLIIGVVVFCVVLVVAAPASIAMGYIRPELERTLPGLKLGEASGSIWQGETQLQAYTFPIVDARWKLKPLPLLAGTVAVELQLSGPGIDAAIDGQLTSEGGVIHASSIAVDGHFINQVTAGRGVSFTETFSAHQVNIQFDRNFIDELSGIIEWPGGLIHVQTPEQYHSVSLPPLRGTLGSEPDRINMIISHDGGRLISIKLDRNGWASVDVTYDFMNLAALPYSGSDTQNGQASAILIEEKIL